MKSLFTHQAKYMFDDNRYPRWLKIAVAINDKWGEVLTFVKYYEIRSFVRNLPFFIKAAWRFKPWDYTFNVELFAESLEYSSKKIEKYGWAVRAKQIARRGYTMSGYLKQAYLGEVHDGTYEYMTKKNPLKFIREKTINKNGFEYTACKLTRNYKTKQELCDELLKRAEKRVGRIEKERKEYAWKYVTKYIEHLWD